MSSYSCILLDIEGTTTAIKFVKDVLFPYITNNLVNYLETKWNSEELQCDIDELRKQVVKDKENNFEGVCDIASKDSDKSVIIKSLIENINWLMSLDRKVTALKQLQGHMWQDGYKSGLIQGHIYEDVIDGLKKWTSSGKKVYIYSSGSIEAQKLLFGYSIFGDLLHFFSGHFDTQIGMKTDASSYAKITKEVGVTPQEILFLTDIPAEACAANQSGLKAKIVVRPGNAPLDDASLKRFISLTTFADVDMDCVER